MELAVVPVFQAEIVPKQVRGLVVETYQLMLFVSDTFPLVKDNAQTRRYIITSL